MTRIWLYFRQTVKTNASRIRELAQSAAAQKGIELSGCTIEPAQKSLLYRSGIREIMDAASRQSFDVLLCPSIDDLSKKQTELEPFLKLLNENGIILRTQAGVIRVPDVVC